MDPQHHQHTTSQHPMMTPPLEVELNGKSSPASSSLGASSEHHWNGVLDSAFDAIGNTPLIKLSRLAAAHDVKCTLLGKVEFFSAGGSIKDRIAKRMVLAAERDGRLVPGKSTVIEPTSGNTGIGLALTCALRGYKCIITLPAKMSLEKEATLRALGAEVIRTPTEAPWDSEESHIGVAKRLERAIEGAVILDQYANENNPLAHYHTTYQEIKHSLESSNLDNKNIDALVAGAGTGGTITGLSRAIRDDFERSKKAHHVGGANGLGKSGGLVGAISEAVKGLTLNGGQAEKDEETSASSSKAQRQGQATIVVGVDPVGSILGGGEQVGSYQVEGIGYDFVPDVLDPSEGCIDQWVKTDDNESFAMAREVIRTEALLIGGSSGASLAGAIKFLTTTDLGKEIAADPEKNVVVVLPDGIRNYISKDWFLESSLKAPPSELRREIDGILSG